jgi:hypothetical protein
MSNEPEATALRINVFPNPSMGDMLQIEVNALQAEEEVVVSLYNNLGSRILTKLWKADGYGNLQKEIKFASRLSSGMYTLVLQSKERTVLEKVTVTK